MKMKKIDPMQEQLRLQEMYQYEKEAISCP